MATLFQLYSNLESIESDIKIIQTLWQENDAILLLGETIAFCQHISILCQPFITPDISDNSQTLQTYYALQKDIDKLTITLQKKITQTALIQVITDEEWIGLSMKFNKVVTISI